MTGAAGGGAGMRCAGRTLWPGRRAGPTEDCGGPWAILERRQHYSAAHIARRLLGIFEVLAGDQDQVDELDEHDRDDYDQTIYCSHIHHLSRVKNGQV
jgi:hypothetical protein